MNWLITENNKKINTYEIPIISIEDLRVEISNLRHRPIGFFGKQEYENVRLYVVLSDDKQGKLMITSVLFSAEEKAYESLTKDFPQFHIFEREFFEEFKIEPLNHPWLKPVRTNQDKYPFFEMKGEDVHEVAVGPIHAGVIEPGHFRFMCQGEKVYDLEIMLGYQNRGVEKLLLNGINNRLAESICGDSVISYNMAYSQVIEALSNTSITKRAEIIRRIALEMERVAIHIGDMGAIAGDIAYLMGASIFGTTRTLVINTMLEISGSRFGRGLIDVGGVNFDIDDKMSERIISMLNTVENYVDKTANVMLNMPSCTSRMERTGVVNKETTIALGGVGMAARASGINLDSRFDHHDIWYKRQSNTIDFKATGDVYSRCLLRYKEIKESIEMIKDFIKILKEHQDGLKTTINELTQNSLVISITEGWRGEVVHIGITGENSELIRYKIKDPSFNNWYMLAMAVRNNGISDFPLCNKSFNLSYCGNDL
ncbi:NADH-quinone oxidoreductase subunit C [bacterium]|nr:NADH-quinone oxidoreductase subunit C [bacterium]